MQKGHAAAQKASAVAELPIEAHLSVTSQKHRFGADVLMPMRHDIELPALEYEICTYEIEEGTAQRHESTQKRDMHERFAEHGGYDYTSRETEKKRRVCLDLPAQCAVFRMPGVDAGRFWPHIAERN